MEQCLHWSSPLVISTVTLTWSVVSKYLILSQHMPGLGWLLSPPMSPCRLLTQLDSALILGTSRDTFIFVGTGWGGSLVKTLLSLSVAAALSPGEVAEELNLESSPLRPGVVALTAKLKSSPSLIRVPRNLSWMQCSLQASQGI